MFRWMFTKLIRWCLRRKIAYLRRMMMGCSEDADISRDGESPSYWNGKLDGIEAALIMTGLIDIGDADVRAARADCEYIRRITRRTVMTEETGL